MSGETTVELRAEPPTVDELPAPSDGGADRLTQQILGEERRRTVSAGLAVVLISAAIATYFVAFAPERTTVTWLGTGYGVLLVLVTGVLWLRNRARRYGDVESSTIGLLATVGVVAGCAWLGPASMATAPLPLLVFYYGLADSSLRRWTAFVSATLGYGLVLVAVAAGWIAATGLIAPDPRYEIGVRGYLFEGAFVELLIVVSFLLARLSRQSTLQAIEALEQARLRIAKQNALLEEARANFERVVLGARLGRFTGQAFAGFTFGEVLGRGAMGEVYDARDEAGASAAVKIMHAQRAEQELGVERFRREAEVTRALASKRIPSVIASGQTPDGSPFIAMEKLHGQDLAELLRERGQLPLDDVTRLVTEVAEGLASAHAAEIVHRDIKPQNLFLAEDRGWVILDFGVSRILAPGNTLTQRGVVGTPSYMAPEQVLSSRVDGRADLFALATVAYRALTGRPAFSASSPALTMYVITSRQPARPSALVALPAGLELVLALALAKDPDERIASAPELAAAWAAACQGRLDPRLVARARALLEREPWGSRRDAREVRASS